MATQPKSLPRRVLRGFLDLAVAALAVFVLQWLVWGRWCVNQASTPRVEVAWEEAIADGVLSDEDLAAHYAPDLLAAVNVMISGHGRGDFLAAVDYDGNLAANDNWEHLNRFPLRAVVYYAVQETETHYFLTYAFYHPRDDAEIWLDCHENDLEGVTLAVRKAEAGFNPPEIVYMQAHGGVSFCFDDPALQTVDPARYGGNLALSGDRPVLYITPNGTLNAAGHSIESAANHSTYWSVGNSGVYYYHGGVAEEPSSYRGDYTRNPCSYQLVSLDELWRHRDGPYGDGALFGSYGAFRGDNWGTDKANPPWAWRNKDAWGISGTFLSDPAWVLSHALVDLPDYSPRYLRNAWADWRVTLTGLTLPDGVDPAQVHLRLVRDGWTACEEAWSSFSPSADGQLVPLSRDTLWLCAPAGTRWSLQAVDAAGQVVEGASIRWEAVDLRR